MAKLGFPQFPDGGVNSMHTYTHVQTGHFQLDSVPCIQRLCLPNIISQSLSLANLSLMATSEHGDEAEVAASIHCHSPGQPSLEPQIPDTTLQASLSTVLGMSDETTHERETPLSTNQISGVFFDIMLHKGVSGLECWTGGW